MHTYITNECFGTKAEVVSVVSENEVKVMFVKLYGEFTATHMSKRHNTVKSWDLESHVKEEDDKLSLGHFNKNLQKTIYYVNWVSLYSTKRLRVCMPEWK